MLFRYHEYTVEWIARSTYYFVFRRKAWVANVCNTSRGCNTLRPLPIFFNYTTCQVQMQYTPAGKTLQAQKGIGEPRARSFQILLLESGVDFVQDRRENLGGGHLSTIPGHRRRLHSRERYDIAACVRGGDSARSRGGGNSNSASLENSITNSRRGRAPSKG